jgi:molybdate transport system substrate-binding protein
MAPCKLLAILVIILSLAGCSASQEKEEAANCLLIYCGITMRHPIQDIATLFEEKHGCRVAIIQGGSEDLYQSLKLTRKGDLYLPGSPAYREKYLAEGFLGDYVYVGANQAALIVQKGNPKNISADINNLANQRYSVVIGNPESGSIGQQTKKILEKAGIYDVVLRNSVSLPAASRNIRRSIVEDGIDLAMNWGSTASFPENKELMDILVLPESIAPKKKLLLNLLSFSENPELAKEFMLLAVSPEGQAVFKKYSFLDEIAVQGSLQR